MPTTSNFGWTTPADTDLVKDGALAIRTLGNGIDTSMAELKGGTTGQVLSKTSNNDMDFTWVTTDDANAIQNAIVDAKGDLIAATAADTPARLAVGNNGETLVADSSTSTGLRWQTPKTVNYLLNSDMSIWQRGTSLTGTFGNATGTYSADRWNAYISVGSNTISRQSVSDSTNLPNIRYCLRMQRDSGQTHTNTHYLTQMLETGSSIPLAGKTVTISFYARKGANYSAASDILSLAVFTGTGTDQNAISGYTGSATPISTNFTLTTTWQRFSISGAIASTATEIALQWGAAKSGTAGANDWFEITGVQLEIGSVATPFQTATGTLAGELAACQRYYAKSYSSTVAPATTSALGSIVFMALVAYSSNNLRTPIRFPVAMRTAPTITLYSTNSGATGKWYNEGTATDVDAVAHQIGENGFITYQSAGTSNASNVLLFHYVASAEL